MKKILLLLVSLMIVSCTDCRFKVVVRDCKTDQILCDTICITDEMNGDLGHSSRCRVSCKNFDCSDSAIILYTVEVYGASSYSEVYQSQKPFYISELKFLGKAQ